jgi:glycosyltransferase involved in cell wall biosynthesis
VLWYKGADWLTAQMKNDTLKSKPIRLILAGGENPNHTDKKFYKDYFNRIQKDADESQGQITLTGYVEEKDIPLYFAACDLLVLPYRLLMSSSGPLSLAFSYRLPVILSSELATYEQTPDFKMALEESDLRHNDIFFSLKGDVFAQFLENCDLKKLTKFSRLMSDKREFKKIGQEYRKLLAD